MFTLKFQLNMIKHVANLEKKIFILKYGVLRSIMFVFIISMIFTLLKDENLNEVNTWINILIKMGIAIIPGLVIGNVEYNMYRDVIEVKNITKNKKKYKNIVGFFGWGILCYIVNLTLIPFDKISIVSGIILYPVYALLLANVMMYTFNVVNINMLYEEYFKGKHITAIVKNKRRSNKENRGINRAIRRKLNDDNKKVIRLKK